MNSTVEFYFHPCEYCKGYYIESNGTKVTCDKCKISGWGK